MNPVSAWAASAPFDISEGQLLWERQLKEYKLSIFSSQNSLWLVAGWPGGGKVGFRAVFALGAVFESVAVEQDRQTSVRIGIECRLGRYIVEVDLPQTTSPAFHYTTVFTPIEDLYVPFSPRDVVPLPDSQKVGQSEGTVHVTQEGTRSGHLFFSLSQPVSGSVFYFQNLTALSAYCDATQTSVGGSVGGIWPEMGFCLPETKDKPLPKGNAYVISDAVVLLSEAIFDQPAEIAKRYLDVLAETYLLLPRPETSYVDWPDIATKGLGDLQRNKGCWTQAEGKSFLNAYVCDYDTPPEIMVQLAVLIPLLEYFEWQGSHDVLLDDLREGLASFYDDKLKVVQRWLPSLKHRLDESEEQKKAGVMDSWYLHHPLMNLAQLAARGDKEAKDLVLKSIDFPIKVAKHFKYEWPVFYKMDTLEVLKAETGEGKGGEKDVPGAYAHLMLNMRDLTDDPKYFEEAVKAVRKLEGVGFDIFYQANNTAFSAGTLLRMYKETGEEKYLDLSYTCLACLFRNMQVWEGNYGYSKSYSRFFAIYPLSDAPYIAPYEELEVYAALVEFLKAAEDIDVLPSARLLISEFVRYFMYRMPFYYPTMLPPEVISEEVKSGEIDPHLWIPLEDLRDGWEKSGQVGQEVYGAAGAGFGIVPRQYFKCGDSGLVAYCNYPVQKFRVKKDGSATFEIAGDGRLECEVRIMGTPKSGDVRLLERPGKKMFERFASDEGWIAYSVPGNAKLKIEWD